MAQQDNIDHWKGAVLGAAGGAAGVVAMEYYWKAVTALTGSDPRKETAGGGPHALDDISLVGTHHEPDEASTEAVGRHLKIAATGEPPTPETKEVLSNEVHWGYGTIMGALYGALRGGATAPPDPLGALAYAVGLWLLGSEVAVPLLGFAPGPTTQPPAAHAYGLGAHLAYGLAVATTTQVLYRVL